MIWENIGSTIHFTDYYSMSPNSCAYIWVIGLYHICFRFVFKDVQSLTK